MAKQSKSHVPITDHLKQIQREQKATTAENEVYYYFWRKARILAEVNVNQGLKGKVDYSQIANDAMQRAMKLATTQEYLNRDDFERDLMTAVQNKKISAIRRERAAKRSAAKTQPLENDPIGSSLSPEMKASLDELATKTNAYLREKYDEKHQRIIKMGIYDGLTGKEIWETLRVEYPGCKGLGLRNIQLTIKKFIAQIRLLLNPDDANSKSS